MKKIIGLLLYLFAGILFAQQIDVTLSQGIEQSIINKFAPKPGSPEVDANVTIKALFNEALNPMFAKQSVSLKRLTNEKTKTFFGFGFGKQKGKQSIQGDTTYDASVHMITFTPNKPLQVGFYEVSFRHLMTQTPGMGMRISPIVYRFYVPEVINGFKLPPEPDEEKNNKTLLGIDFNDNGIRDDVERFIVNKYKNDNKIVTEIGFQLARAYQKILENPLDTKANYTALDAAMDCNHYFKFTAKHMKNGDVVLVNHYLGEDFKNLQLNRKSRVKAYLEYDAQISGGVYTATPLGQEEKKKCNFDVASLLGAK